VVTASRANTDPDERGAGDRTRAAPHPDPLAAKRRSMTVMGQHLRDVEPSPTTDELAARILTLPDVSCVLADEQSGAPEVSWGDRFFFAGSDRERPFATIVERDYPGWDEASNLDRAGVFRLNIDLGREALERELGFCPAEFAQHRASFDFTQLDELLPHPAYATQGWACILNPSASRLSDLDRLLAVAHRRAVRRRARTSDR
jgi:hypothetical protein